MVHVLLLVLAVWVHGCVAYLVMLTAGALLFRKKSAPMSDPMPLLVVIPAHNEAGQIGDTVSWLLQCDYPRECFDVAVLADNCSDATAEEARQAGAFAVERTQPDNPGKGQALDWFLRTRLPGMPEFDKAEALVFVDADTRVSPLFLREMSRSLQHPEIRVVQGYYGVSNPGESWRTALAYAALCVFHHLRPAGREFWGGSVGLKGNGMGFRRTLLQRFGWPAHSVVEDLEFSLLLMQEGVLVHFNPDARVYGEMAATRQQADSQRRRWEGGRFGLLKKHGWPLLRQWLREPRFRHADALLELLTPPLTLLVLGELVLLAGAALFWPGMQYVNLISLGLLCVYVSVGLLLEKAPLRIWISLAMSPFFVLWKIVLYAGMPLARRTGWIRTLRSGELDRSKERQDSE